MNYNEEETGLKDALGLIEALTLFIKHERDEKQKKYRKQLDKYSISDLESLASNWHSTLTHMESEIEAGKKDYETNEEFHNLLNLYHELQCYLDRRKEKEESEAKARGEAKVRKKILEDNAAKEALERARQGGLSNLDTEIKKTHWSELASPCKKSPHLSMVLLPEGMTEQMIGTKECLKGQGKGVMKNLEVTYDKEYVIEWLKVKVVNPLKELPLETIQSLIAEAYEQLKS